MERVRHSSSVQTPLQRRVQGMEDTVSEKRDKAKRVHGDPDIK